MVNFPGRARWIPDGLRCVEFLRHDFAEIPSAGGEMMGVVAAGSVLGIPERRSRWVAGPSLFSGYSNLKRYFSLIGGRQCN
jgi:hypothetical protein